MAHKNSPYMILISRTFQDFFPPTTGFQDPQFFLEILGLFTFQDKLFSQDFQDFPGVWEPCPEFPTGKLSLQQNKSSYNLHFFPQFYPHSVLLCLFLTSWHWLGHASKSPLPLMPPTALKLMKKKPSWNAGKNLCTLHGPSRDLFGLSQFPSREYTLAAKSLMLR